MRVWAMLLLGGILVLSSAGAFRLQVTVTGEGDQAPLALRFTAQPSEVQGQVSFQWDFGDGGSSREQNPTHTFYAPGRYPVRVTATDALGRRLTSRTEIEVKGDPAQEGARITVLLRPNGTATLSTASSRIYGPLERTLWTVNGQRFERDTLELSHSGPGPVTVDLSLSSRGRTFPAQVRFPVGRYATQGSFGEEVLKLVNAARARGWRCDRKAYGGKALAPLKRNPLLDRAAMAHATAMAAAGFFNHVSPLDGSGVDARALAAGYRFQAVGENIAAGQQSPAEVVQDWLESPGHCANIMGDFLELGVAYLSSPGSQNPTQWVQVFGKAFG